MSAPKSDETTGTKAKESQATEDAQKKSVEDNGSKAKKPKTLENGSEDIWDNVPV